MDLIQDTITPRHDTARRACKLHVTAERDRDRAARRVEMMQAAGPARGRYYRHTAAFSDNPHLFPSHGTVRKAVWDDSYGRDRLHVREFLTPDSVIGPPGGQSFR